MAKFKMRVDFENEPVVKAKADNLDDFDNVMEGLKAKFGRRKR